MVISSDYATFEGGRYSAYYGYEFDIENGLWGFEVRRDECRVYWLTFDDMRDRRPQDRLDKFNVTVCLLVGMELYWEDNGPDDVASKLTREGLDIAIAEKRSVVNLEIDYEYAGRPNLNAFIGSLPTGCANELEAMFQRWIDEGVF